MCCTLLRTTVTVVQNDTHTCEQLIKVHVGLVVVVVFRFRFDFCALTAVAIIMAALWNRVVH